MLFLSNKKFPLPPVPADLAFLVNAIEYADLARMALVII